MNSCLMAEVKEKQMSCFSPLHMASKKLSKSFLTLKSHSYDDMSQTFMYCFA